MIRTISITTILTCLWFVVHTLTQFIVFCSKMGSVENWNKQNWCKMSYTVVRASIIILPTYSLAGYHSTCHKISLINKFWGWSCIVFSLYKFVWYAIWHNDFNFVCRPTYDRFHMRNTLVQNSHKNIILLSKIIKIILVDRKAFDLFSMLSPLLSSHDWLKWLVKMIGALQIAE